MSSLIFLPGKNLPEKEGIEGFLQNICTMLICTISPSYTIKSRWATNCQNSLFPETAHIYDFVSGNLPAEKKESNIERRKHINICNEIDTYSCSPGSPSF